MVSSTVRLFDTWERALPLSPAGRALLLARTVEPDRGEPLSLGDRDAALLTLRYRAFGPSLTGVGRCPNCNERLEIDLAIDELLGSRAELGTAATRSVSVVVDDGGWHVVARLPQAEDMIAIDGATGDAADELWRRCAAETLHDGKPVDPDVVPDEIRVLVGERLEEEDPLTLTELGLCCPDCGTDWREELDIAAFLWAEVDLWARRLLEDIHVLALSYGWDEEQILDLSPLRRQAYLDLVGA
jgi:hypothetical protein